VQEGELILNNQGGVGGSTLHTSDSGAERLDHHLRVPVGLELDNATIATEHMLQASTCTNGVDLTHLGDKVSISVPCHEGIGQRHLGKNVTHRELVRGVGPHQVVVTEPKGSSGKQGLALVRHQSLLSSANNDIFGNGLNSHKIFSFQENE
jgi:hypothetical protein